ncbi:MAG TPA: ABC transporter substrate-binding protein [Thermomicrobiales bacterium]|nr:ABC transporter substrate-binding protein [Thermomicrobiales bacterium]
MRVEPDRNRVPEAAQTRVLRRRDLLRGLAAGAGAAAGAVILAACGGAAATPTSSPAAPTATPAAGGAAATAPSVGTAAPSAPAIQAPAATSTSAAATTPAAAGGGGQVSMLWAKPVTLNPLFSTAGSEQGVEQLILGALVKVNDRLDVLPDIAAKIDVAPDAKTYTFHLKKTLKFTDGQPLTAKDVVFTIERAVDKRTGSFWRGRLLEIAGATEYGDQKAETISGLTTPDDYTVQMTLVAGDSTWLLTLGDFAGMGILPAHVLQDVAPDKLKQHAFSLKPDVSAGVFRFGQYATDQYLELRRNDGYGGGTKAKLDRVFLKILTPDVALAQLDKGDLDLMTVPVAEIARLKQNPNLTVVSVPSPSISFIAVNLEKPYLQDKRVRQAMMYAIDRVGIVQSIYQGEAQVVNQTIVGPDWMGTPEGLNPYAFDPTKARQLLKDAGWESARKIEAIYIPGSTDEDAYVPIIQQQLKDVGVMLDLRQVERTEYTSKRNSSDFELVFVGGGIFRQDPNVSSKYFETANWVPAGANYSHYSNKQVDDLFAAGRATTDTAERKKIYTQIATTLNDEVPWIYLWSPNSLFAHTKRLAGFKPPSYATHDMWNADEWTVTG